MSKLPPHASIATPPAPEAEGYEVHEFLGRGSSGTVWRATQDGTLREVALKFLAPWHAHSLAEIRFAREVEIAASLEHGNIARVFGSGEGSGGQWLAMELVDGPPVDRWVTENDPALRNRVELFRQICTAVRHAHQRGVIHRDLKPSNVLVTREGTPKVVDFGLACWQEGPSMDVTLTRQGEVFGSLAWMPPEQASGRWAEVDALSDVYALGAILYSLVAGGPPLDQSLPPGAMLAAAQSGERRSLRTVRPGTPRDLAAIVEKCLAPVKARRYQSAAELEDDVARWLAGEPVRARAAAPLYWLSKKMRRHWAVVAAGITLLGAAAGLVWGYFQGQKSLEDQKRQALEREAAQTARTLHEAQELVTQLLVEMRPKLEAAGHPEWVAEAEKRVAAFPWDMGGGGAYDPRRFRARMSLLSAEMLTSKGQWGGALAAWQEAASQLKPLVDENPRAAIFREELGRARMGEETALLKLGYHREAVSAGQKALAALTPPEGELVSPASLSAMVNVTCILADAAFSAKGKTDDALEAVTSLTNLLPSIERAEDMTEEQSIWHARIGRERARLVAALKTPAEADPVAVRAVACARQACRLTGNGEMASRILAETLAAEADIARMQDDARRTFDRLTEATSVLGGRKTKTHLSLSDQPVLEVARAWERYAVWMEESKKPAEAIEGNRRAIELLGISGRRNSAEVKTDREQAGLMLRNAQLSRQLHQTPEVIRWAKSAVSRFRTVMEKTPAKVAPRLDRADAALILAEVAAPPPDGQDSWAGMAERSLQLPREKQAMLVPAEKQRLAELEKRLAAMAAKP